MNAGIILQGRSPDIVNSLAQGTRAAAMTNQVRQQNALADLYRTQGAGIAAGDQNALSALAAQDPMAARAVQEQIASGNRADAQLSLNQRASNRSDAQLRLNMQASERLTAAEARAVEDHKAKVGAAQAATEAAQAEQVLFGAAQLIQQGDLPGANKMLMDVDLIPVPLTDPSQFAIVAGKSKAVIDALKTANERNTVNVGGILYEIPAKGPPIALTEKQETLGQQIEVISADGTSLRVGERGLAPGQDPTTTATPRDGGKLSEALSKADAAYLDSERTKARSAEELEGVAERLETLGPRIGYTGPGGKAYGALDDAVRVLPGDEGARAAFRSDAVLAQLTFTEKTKGAITDLEMALFAAASPNLGNTPEGNKMIAQILRAGAVRVQTRAKFMEAYAGKRGSLEGAEGAWDAYMADNPILVEGSSGLTVMREGDWRSAVNDKQAIDYTPQAIMGVSSISELEGIFDSLNTSAQIDAAMKRLDELEAGN